MAVQYPGVAYIAFYMQYRGGLNFSERHSSVQYCRSLAALTRYVECSVSTPPPLPRCAHSFHLQHCLCPPLRSPSLAQIGRVSGRGMFARLRSLVPGYTARGWAVGLVCRCCAQW